MMSDWGNGGWGWGTWLPMMLMMLILFAVIIGAVLMFTHSWTSRLPPHDHSERVSESRRILDERFARGEIDEDEYRKRKDVLDEGR
ncbi:MAG: SHOCT domain-containing protein [Acidimicrobiales bacterium]